ncbi:Cochaperone prefoldin complex subunit [Elasticomyces elasticus]|nr:Cochaperone prefoldin complex subunit [Elasticomyces elasticus]
MTKHHAATYHKPRFLFRAASDQSHGINTAFEIDQLAGGDYHQDLASTPRGMPGIMLAHHFVWNSTEYNYESELSSWSVSLLWVLVHAIRKDSIRGEQNVQVYVLDTQGLSHNRVHRATDLVRVFKLGDLHNGNMDAYCQGEYLIHGKLANNDGFKAVALEQLVDAGLYRVFPALKTGTAQGKHQERLYLRVLSLREELNATLLSTTPSAISLYKSLAACFGEQWEATLTLAFFSLRSYVRGMEAINDLSEALEDLPLPQLSRLRNAMAVTNNLPDDGITEHSRFMQLLQKLCERRLMNAPDLEDLMAELTVVGKPTHGHAPQHHQRRTEATHKKTPVCQPAKATMLQSASEGRKMSREGLNLGGVWVTRAFIEKCRPLPSEG